MNLETGLPSYPDNYFDLAIVDPPYGIGESGKTNHTRGNLAVSKNYGDKEWDKSPPEIEFFIQLKRTSRNQVIFGANHFISRIKEDSPCWIVWDKDNGKTDFADCELAYTSFKSAVRKAKFRWQGMLQQDMKNKEIRIHPTQKPVALYKWILENYAKPGDMLLDTHVGSASSLIAFEAMVFDYHAFEKDPDYYAAAQKRMNAGIQKDLFAA